MKRSLWRGLFLLVLGVGMVGGGGVMARGNEQTTAVFPIPQLQGTGDTSPFVEQNVRVRGVVTGVHISQNSRGVIYHTVFVQDSGDGDAATSDGLPLFVGQKLPDVQVGDVVEAEGRIIEFYGLTEMSDWGIKWQKVGQEPLPAPVLLTSEHLANLEPLEGMLVAMPEAVVMGPTHAGCGFAVALPAQSARLLKHETGMDTTAVLPILFATNVDCTDWPQLKTGDVIRNLSGPLTYHFDQYKMVLQDPSQLEIIPSAWPPLPPVPSLQEGEISIASFNLYNHFDSQDDTGLDSEPKPTSEEISLKETKIAHAVQEVLGCPTLIGIQEVENEALLLALAERIAPLCGFTYEVSHRESWDGRGIDVALLSDPRRVAVTAVSLFPACTPLQTGLGTSGCPTGQEQLFARPPLGVELLVDNQPVVVYVNHFKSKLGGEAETTPMRIAQAEHQRGLVTAVLSANPTTHVIVMGDFNDYADSAPMQRFMAEGAGQLENVLRRLPPPEQYSYVYAGVSQLIDGFWLPAHTAVQTRHAQIQHVNADLPASIGQDLSPLMLPFGSSDHDLPLMVLDVRPPAPEQVQAAETEIETETRPWLLPLLALTLTLTLILLIIIRRRKPQA
jgi:uncharacterized protein